MAFYRVGVGDATNNYNNLSNQPQINGVTLVGNKTGADLQLGSWSTAQTLAEGVTSVTFTGLNTNYAYELYSETVDGTPVYIIDYVVSGTSVTYTILPITSAQTGSGGTGCHVKLRCLY